jgi:YgiT-type zinc finger domain-containing protein
MRSMMKCPICKGTMVLETAEFTTELNGEEIVLEDVQVWVCEQCENVELDPEVQEAIEDMLASLQGGLASEEPPEHIDLD